MNVAACREAEAEQHGITRHGCVEVKENRQGKPEQL